MTPERLREMRQRFGETQEQMAARVGVKLGVYQQWEHGRRSPSSAARALLEQIEVESFLEDEQPQTMKCLSVLQPWAYAIMTGIKEIENRSWRTDHRGPLLIHAGRSNKLYSQLTWGEPGHAEAFEDHFGFQMPAKEEELVRGAILGKVELVDVVPGVEVRGEAFAEGPWCWILEKARAFRKPVPFLGSRKLFDVPVSELP